MEYEEVRDKMDALVRGYFNIVANTLAEAGYRYIPAQDLQKLVYGSRVLIAPEYQAIFDAAFSEMVDAIDDAHDAMNN